MKKAQALKELKQWFEKVKKSDGSFITIHCKNGKKIEHWSGCIDFPPSDVEPSLFAILDTYDESG